MREGSCKVTEADLHFPQVGQLLKDASGFQDRDLVVIQPPVWEEMVRFGQAQSEDLLAALHLTSPLASQSVEVKRAMDISLCPAVLSGPVRRGGSYSWKIGTNSSPPPPLGRSTL